MKEKKVMQKKKTRLFKNILASLLALVLVVGNFSTVFAEGETEKEEKSIFQMNNGDIETTTNTKNNNTSDDLIISAKQSTIAGDFNNRYIDVNVSARGKDKKFSNAVAYAKINSPKTVYINGSGTYYLSDFTDFNTFRIDVSTLDTNEDVTVPIEITVKYDVEKIVTETNTIERPDTTTITKDKSGTRIEVNNELKKSNNNSTDIETREVTTTIYVIHRAEKLASNSALEISKVDIHPNGYVVPGSNFSLVFTVKNVGDAEAKNIKATLEGMDPKGINIAQGLATKDITILKPGEETTLIYDMKIPPSAKGGMYPLTLKYDFNGKNAKGNETTSPISGSYALSVDVNQADRDPSALIFERINFPTGRLGKNQNVPVSFTLKNIGTKNAQNIKITAISQDVEGLTPVSASTAIVEKILPGQSADYQFDFKTTNSVATKSYPVEITVEYTDNAVSEEPHKITQIVGVNGVDWRAEAEKDKDRQTSTPILIIEKYSFDPELIYAGTQFKMDLVIRNTSDKAIKNIKIALSSDAAQSSTEGKPATQASVFTPVQSSNTFFIDSIPAGQKVDKQITMTTSHDTAANTYTLTADVTYEDSQAKQYTSKEIIGVTVVQDSKFSIGEVVLDPTFFVGMPGNISVDFYNTGKVTLSNFMVEFESDDEMSVDMPTYYKGNFPSGTTDTYSATLTVNSPEAKKGKLIFSYEDTTGQSHTMEKEFEVTVEDMPMPDEDMGEMPMEPEETSKKPIIIGSIIGLLALGLGAVLFKKHKKKKEEEDLKIDED